MTDYAALRREYRGVPLDEAAIHAHPIAQFTAWFDAAVDAGQPEPNAMALATVTPEGLPAVRMVILKALDLRGFVFATSYDSDKAADLATTPRAALLFRWDRQERQVRVAGAVERLTAAESDALFAARPRGAKLAAWASPQSRVVPDRAALEARLAATSERLEDTDPLPRPDHWGGYRVMPDVVELWQGREHRLHDRLRYRRAGVAWAVERLAP